MILVLDTSMGGYNLALIHQGQLVVSKADPCTRELSENLVSDLKDMLEQSGHTFQDITTLVMTSGPGTFTGIRVGFALMNTLSVALSIPFYGCSTFEVCRAMVQEYEKVVVILDSKRAEPFVQTFGCPDSPFLIPQTATIEAISSSLTGDEILVGNGFSMVKHAHRVQHIQGLDPLILADIALKKRELAKPFYVRPPDVTLT